MKKPIRRFILPVFLILLILPISCFAWTGQVVYVADGDTITVTHGGRNVKVRLYGIDTPERSQYYGQNAKQFISSQVMMKTVEVEEMDVDRYGRVVALVSVGDLILNRHLVEYGYAWVYDQYCKDSFCREWKDLQATAKQKKRGLWKNPDVMAPWEYRHGGKKSEPVSPVPSTTKNVTFDCSRNRYNCSDFKTQAEAQACHDQCLSVTGRDVHQLDRDHDGVVCESLP